MIITSHSKRSPLHKYSVAVGIIILSGFNAQAATISYPDFSSLTGLQRNGATAAISNPVGTSLRLTDNLSQSGSAFSTNAISLAANVSFSTYFKFNISNPIGISDADGQGADGIVFVVQTVSNTAGGSGGGIGYQGLLNSVGIEFDTWFNSGVDINGNHLGIDLNGNTNSVVSTPIATRMNNGQDWYSWVDYDGTTNLLEARLSMTNTRPVASTLSYTVDLASVLGSTNAFVGFTSGTGAAGGYHDILSWEFRDTYNPVGAPDGGATIVLLGIAFTGIVSLRRKFARD
jgi:hypothetical protein